MMALASAGTRDTKPAPVRQSERGHVAIAVNELDGNGEFMQTRERFAHHRTGDHATADDFELILHPTPRVRGGVTSFDERAVLQH